MKIFAYLFVVTVILASCSTNFTPCVDNKPITEKSSVYLPLKMGNEWVYRYKSFENKTDTVINQVQRIKVTSIDTIKFPGDNKMESLPVYRTSLNEKPTNNIAYSVCDFGVVYILQFDFNPFGFVHSIPNVIKSGAKDTENSSVKWHGPVTITVPAGTFECYYCEYDSPFDPRIECKDYYSKGVGLVRNEKIHFNLRSGKIFELQSYTVK